MLIRGNDNFCFLGDHPSGKTKLPVTRFESVAMFLDKQPHYFAWPWYPYVHILKYILCKWERLKYMFSLKCIYVIGATEYNYLKIKNITR
jgi:hypothetical protein